MGSFFRQIYHVNFCLVYHVGSVRHMMMDFGYLETFEAGKCPPKSLLYCRFHFFLAGVPSYGNASALDAMAHMTKLACANQNPDVLGHHLHVTSARAGHAPDRPPAFTSKITLLAPFLYLDPCRGRC